MEVGPDKYFLENMPRPPYPFECKRYHKKISVKSAFDSGRVPAKIIASYDKWLEFEYIYLKNGLIAFREIQDFISCYRMQNAKEQRALIETYSREWPERFSREFYYEFIWHANLINPANELQKKQRCSYYGLNRGGMLNVRYTAIHLYVYLHYWFKKPEAEYPDLLKNLLNRYNIETKNAVEATRQIISKYFDIRGMDKTDSRNFYERFIVFRRSLNAIKTAYKNIKYDLPPQKRDCPPNIGFLANVIYPL